MPRIKRWFPVSHDVNSDHELWTLTDTIGDRAFRVWMEFLSICDRNDGELGPWSDSYAKAIAFKCHTTPTKVRQVFDFALSHIWLLSDPIPRTRNHAKYHERRDAKKNPAGNSDAPSLPSEPSEPSEPSLKKIQNAPSADSSKQEKAKGEKPAWKDVTDRLFKSDKEKFARLIQWILRARHDGYFDSQIKDALDRFEPMAPEVQNWWPYLDQILHRHTAKANAQASKESSDRLKEQEREWLAK